MVYGMVEKQSIFLTTEQALEAICNDFRQYEPQTMLFCEIIRLISDGKITARRETDKDGAWIARAGRQKMRWMNGTELVDYMCELLRNSNLSADSLAPICARVFQTRAYAEAEAESGRRGIRIETGMENFECNQCGQCCLSLDYQDQLKEKDVRRWQKLKRSDILEWVGVFKRNDEKKDYRIWMTPGTRQLAEKCPFLQKEPTENKWTCRIHDVKPGICRQYPVSRKHAIMTGCPGFDNPPKSKKK